MTAQGWVKVEVNRQKFSKKNKCGIFLVVQWLRLRASNAAAMGLISGQGTKIAPAIWQKKKKKNKYEEDFQTKEDISGRGNLFLMFIYLCGCTDSSLQHVGSLVEVCKLLFSASGI